MHLNSRVRADGRVEWKHHFARLANALAADPAAASATAAQQDALRDVLSTAGWTDLAGVRAPITLIRGDRGFVTPEDAAEFSRRLPAASIVEVASGHNVQEEQPVELGRRIATLSG